MKEPRFTVLYNRFQHLRLNLFDCSVFIDKTKCDTYSNLITALLKQAPGEMKEGLDQLSYDEIIELIRPQVEKRLDSLPEQ